VSIVEEQPREGGHYLPLMFFVFSLLPGGLAVRPGAEKALWVITDPEAQSYHGPLYVAVHWALLIVAVMPFVAAALVLVLQRIRGRSWAETLESAARFTATFGAVSLIAAIVMGGLR
jgi:hypothetical protein